MQQIRTVFFGTPAFVTAPLQALVNDPRFEVVAVVTQPGKPVGRDGTVQPSPVAETAARDGIPALTPENLRDPGALENLRGFSADLFVIDAYGKILPKDVLDLPRHGCVNLHPSLLPKFRGATPVPFTILAGDDETGMTFMRMSEGMDEGDILAVLHDRVLAADDAPTLLDRLNGLAAETIGDILVDFIAGKLAPMPQDHSRATYSTLLTKEHGRIDWGSDTAVMVERKLRAFAPWPGIFTFYQGKRLKVLACEVSVTFVPPTSPPGTLVSPDLIVTAGGLLRILTVQPEGRNPMPFIDFLKGIREKDPIFG